MKPLKPYRWKSLAERMSTIFAVDEVTPNKRECRTCARQRDSRRRARAAA